VLRVGVAVISPLFKRFLQNPRRNRVCVLSRIRVYGCIFGELILQIVHVESSPKIAHCPVLEQGAEVRKMSCKA
jgi:hypothetical protein